MTTGSDIVISALKKSGVIGIGRAPSAADSQDALSDLNDMLAQWDTQRWMVWNLIDLGLTSTGANSYTVGPGGNFNVSRRPDRLEAAYQRQLVQSGLDVDTPIEIIPSYEEYSRLSLKGLVSFGLYAYLDASWPLANLLLYPIPNANTYAIHILLKNVMPTIELATDLSNFPTHYIAAMKFNLAQRLRQAYGKGMSPDIALDKLARSSLAIVKQSNLQVPELVMPKVLITQSSGYNILSDQFGNG